MSVTKEQMDSLRALAAGATPGPWRENRHEVLIGEDWVCLGTMRNAAYVAAIPPDVVVALLDRIEALEAERVTLHHKAGDALHSLRALLDGERATVIDRGRYWRLHGALRAGEPLKVAP